MLTRAGSPLRQWLLNAVIAVIAVGLIAMHHVVAGPTGMMSMEQHAPVSSAVAVPVPSVSVSGSGCLDCGAMMGHMCLAVLLAAVALLTGLALFTIPGSPRGPSRPSTVRGGARPARAPPDSAVRLSQLGVLRR